MAHGQSSSASSTTGPTVVVTGDRMAAILRIPGDSPSSLVHTSGLMQLIRDSGLPTGDDTATMIDQAVRQFHDCPRELRITVGQGVAPQRGTDGRLEWQPGFEPDADQPAPQLTDEPVNYYECSRFVSVREGQHIATLVPPEPGRPGFDVYGKRLSPMPGKPFPLKTDPSIRVLGDGRILADRNGLLTHGPRSIHVSPVLEIAEHVNFSTGNVHFNGSVMIGQGVRDRFRVEATEDVICSGLIEAAHIQCGGSFRAEGGMAGREIGSIDVADQVFARYLVGVRGRVGGDLVAQKEVINCDLRVGGAVEVRGGAVIGGRIALTGKAEVGELGSDAGVATELRLGYIIELTDSLNRLAGALTPVDDRIKALRERLEFLAAKVEDAEAQRTRGQVVESMRLFMAKRQKIAAKLAGLTEQFNRTCHVELTVYKAIHPGVVLVLPKARLEFHAKLAGPVTFRRHRDGRVRADNASGEEVTIGKVARILRTGTW